MIIPLASDVRIAADDGVSFTLQRLKTVKGGAHAGEGTWTAVGHYASLEQAAKKAIDKGILAGKGEVSAKKLVAAIDRAAERIARACEGALNASGAASYEGIADLEVPDDLFAEEGTA